MRRREFIRTAGVAGLSSIGLAGAHSELMAQEGGQSPRREQRPAAMNELFELREYQLSSSAQQGKVEAFLEKAFVPALQRQSVGPVGVFRALDASSTPGVWVLIRHQDQRTVASLSEKLKADNQYKTDAPKYLDSPASEPVYDRLRISLSRALDGMPRLEAPERSAGRIFQLRVYQSHSEMAAAKKIEMFTGLGELALFRKMKLTPVFFGQTIIGDGMPNLTYMLTFPNMEVSKKAWADFVGSEEWQKMKVTPGFTDKEIVSKISNLYLAPVDYSQI